MTTPATARWTRGPSFVWLLASALGVGALLPLAYLNRRFLVLLVSAPHTCGVGSGCVDISPLVASLVMYGFAAAVLALALWQILASRPATVVETPARWWLLLVGIFLVALVPRLAAPELRQLRWDETNMAWLAVQGLVDGKLALTGINTSVGIPNPPASIYLLAPVLTPFLERPGSGAAMVSQMAVLGAITSVLCAWFVRRWTGSSGAAVAAGCISALGFWSFFSGRRVWPPYFLPPATLLFIDAVLLTATARHRWAPAWGVGWMALMVQLHYLSLGLIPLLLAALWLGRQSLAPRPLVGGAVLAGLVLAPFLLWEVALNTSFRDVRALMALAGSESQVDLTGTQFVLNLASGGKVEEQIEPLTPVVQPFFGIATVLAGAGLVLLLLGAITWVLRVRTPPRPDQRVVGLFLLAWVLIPPLLVVRHSSPVAQYYFFHVLPGLVVLMATGASLPALLPRPVRATPALRALGRLLLGCYLLGSLWLLGLVLAVSARFPTHHYDIPLGFVSEAGEVTYRAWQEHGRSRPVAVGADARDVDKIRLALGPAVPAIGFDDCRELIDPGEGSGDTVYLLMDDTPSSERLLRSSRARLLTSVPRPDGGVFRVLLVADSGPPIAERYPDQLRWDWRSCVQRYVLVPG